MKRAKLTLIELLISMALFTVMLGILIKAFQLATDLNSTQTETITLNETALVTLNLLANDLANISQGELENYYKEDNSKYSTLSKDAHFYLDFIEGDNGNVTEMDIRFFRNSSNNEQVTAIQYIYNEEQGLVRYEKSFTKTIDLSDYVPSSTDIDVAKTLQAAIDSHFDIYPYAFLGTDDNGTPTDSSDDIKIFPPDLADKDSDLSEIDESTLLLSDSAEILNTPQIKDESFALTIISYDTEENELTGDSDNYENGDLPESLEFGFALTNSDSSNLDRKYSRNIPIAKADFFGSDINEEK